MKRKKMRKLICYLELATAFFIMLTQGLELAKAIFS